MAVQESLRDYSLSGRPQLIIYTLKINTLTPNFHCVVSSSCVIHILNIFAVYNVADTSGSHKLAHTLYY